MTVIIVIKKYFLVLMIVFFIGGVLLNRQLLREISSPKYQIRNQFPPLVFLPDYQKGPKVLAGSSVLMESLSGAVLYGKNPEQRRAPASTTKMMTAIVALGKGRLSQVIKVSRKAAATRGSSIWLRTGDRLTLKELLEGMMLRSGNDGSVAIAEGISGSVRDFVWLMNLKAKEIGALNTNFRNPHGLRAPSHYTTALDLALIARYGLSDPRFAKLVSEKTGLLEWYGGIKKREIKNTNRLLWYLEGADGVKTGTTNEAGHCLVASATRDGKRLIAVVLNSPDRWGDCVRLLEYGFREFQIITIAEHDRAVCRMDVRKGDRPFVNLYPRSDLVAVVPNPWAHQVKPEIMISREPLNAPLRPGQAVGKIGYRFQDKIIEGVDLIVRQPIRRRWWQLW